MRRHSLGASALLFVSCMAPAAPPLPAYIPAPHRAALLAWLKTHPGHRWVSDADCECDDTLALLRQDLTRQGETRVDFHPYFVAGDFNGDGKEDAAFIVQAGEQREVLVLDGGKRAPTFLYPVDRSVMLFLTHPGVEPRRLLIGAPFSEGATLEPVGSGYVLREDPDG